MNVEDEPVGTVSDVNRYPGVPAHSSKYDAWAEQSLIDIPAGHESTSDVSIPAATGQRVLVNRTCAACTNRHRVRRPVGIIAHPSSQQGRLAATIPRVAIETGYFRNHERESCQMNMAQ